MAADTEPQSVLELAAGTGIVTRRLRDALPSKCTLFASDLNAPMLEVAREKFSSGEQVKFETVDATSLGFGDQSYDAVCVSLALCFSG